MSTNSICFHGEPEKIIPELSATFASLTSPLFHHKGQMSLFCQVSFQTSY